MIILRIRERGDVNDDEVYFCDRRGRILVGKRDYSGVSGPTPEE
jgi:hypothetical protein